MNHWPEYINIWHGTSLGQGNSTVFKWSPWGHKWPCPDRTDFYIGLYSKTLYKSSREPLASWMHLYLSWNILRTRRFKFIQTKYLGSQMDMP